MRSGDRSDLIGLFDWAESAIEVGIGTRTDLAAALSDADISVTAVDVRELSVPSGVEFVRADITRAIDRESLTGADLVYARRLPEELQPSARKLATHLGGPLYFTTLGFEHPIVPVTPVASSEGTWFRSESVPTST